MPVRVDMQRPAGMCTVWRDANTLKHFIPAHHIIAADWVHPVLLFIPEKEPREILIGFMTSSCVICLSKLI